MADDVLASFLVALGFRVDQGSQNAAKKSVADYQRAVEQAEKAIEDARWAGAKTEEEVAALTRATNLRLAREALQRAKDEEKLEADKSRKNTERNVAFLANLEKLTLAARAASSAMQAAFGGITSSLNHLYYVSGRTGASAANLKAIGYAFEQTGSSAEDAVAAVESFTQAMRSNPGVKGFVENDLHIDPQLDAVHKLQAAVDTLNERYKDNPAVAQAQATGILGLSVAQYNQLTLQGKEIRRLQAERRAFAKSIGLDDNEGANAAQKLSQSLGSVVMMVGALRDKLAIALVPVVETLVKRFGDWIRSNPKQIDDIITSIARGVTEFATALGKVKWEEVFKGISDFAKGANDAAQSMGGWKVVAEAFFALWAAGRIAAIFAPIMTAISGIRVALLGLGPIGWAMLGIGTLGGVLASADPNKGIVHGGRSPEGSLNPGDELPGVDSSENEPRRDRPRHEAPDSRRWYEKILPKALGGKDAPARDGIHRRAERARRIAGQDDPYAGAGEGADGAVVVRGHRYRAAAGTAQGKANVASWLDFAQRPTDQGGLGLPADKARAVVAGLQGESSANLNPNSKGDYRNGSPTAFGTAQWRLDRAEGLRRTAAEMGTAWNDIRAQQAWMRKEMLEGRYKGVYDAIKSAPTGEHALRAYINQYENPADHAGAYAFRKPYLDTLRRTGNSMPPPAPPAAADQASPTAAAPVAPTPPAANMRGLPNLTPGGWDPNRIDPKDLMRPAPAGASPVTNNNSSSTSKAVTQHITNKVDIKGSDNPREHGRIMESSLSRVHGLALANAQTAVV